MRRDRGEILILLPDIVVKQIIRVFRLVGRLLLDHKRKVGSSSASLIGLAVLKNLLLVLEVLSLLVVRLEAHHAVVDAQDDVLGAEEVISVSNRNFFSSGKLGLVASHF
jgi:hypothetical protein